LRSGPVSLDLRDTGPVSRPRARLLALLSLLQARRAAWAATRLPIGSRSTRARSADDVERLRGSAIPCARRPASGGGYRLGAGAQMPPLLSTRRRRSRSRSACARGERRRDRDRGDLACVRSPSSSSPARAFAAARQRARRRHGPVPVRGPTVEPELLSAIATAVRDSSGCASATRATTAPAARRLVEPHRLVHTGRRWYSGRLGLRTRGLAHLPRRPDRLAAGARSSFRARASHPTLTSRPMSPARFASTREAPAGAPAAAGADRRGGAPRSRRGRQLEPLDEQSCCAARFATGSAAGRVRGRLGLDFEVQDHRS